MADSIQTDRSFDHIIIKIFTQKNAFFPLFAANETKVSVCVYVTNIKQTIPSFEFCSIGLRFNASNRLTDDVCQLNDRFDSAWFSLASNVNRS